MQKLILTLFSVVVLLGLVLPSSAAVIGRKRETNAQRLARGLPPNPPTRRLTAPVRRASSTPLTDQCLEVRTLDGTVLGCVDNGGASHGISVGDKRNWPLTYTPSTMTLNNGAQFLGAHDTPAVVLGPALPTSVFLQKVSDSDTNAEDNLWSVDPNTLEVTATWTNPGNVPVSAQICNDGPQGGSNGSILLSGNCEAAGLTEVLCFLTPI